MASKEILEEIRRRLSIVGVVGERVPLKKSGRNFKGLCPFHQEKTPSFMVSEEKQIFHCFGCATGGDLFTFLMKIDGLTFSEALKELAQKAGVALPAFDKKSSPGVEDEWALRRKWSLRLNEIARDFFVENLQEEKTGKTTRQYLQSRGIQMETAKLYRLGTAGKSWDDLVKVLVDKKAPLKLALELGLIKEREKGEGYYDFFRNRLMFPIVDIKGGIVGFGGRALENDEGAKYLNSPDSLLYHKSQTVYGLDGSKEAIRTQDEVILVEGYLDLIALKQAGVENVVAPLGTALTREHIKLLTRYTHNFVVAFDGDAAGTQAALRSLPLFLELKLVPRALVLPSGQDPDSFIRQFGKEKWDLLKSKAPTLFEYFVDGVIAKAGKGTAATLKAWENIRPLLQRVANPLEEGIYRKKVAEKLGVEERWLKGLTKGDVSLPIPPKTGREGSQYSEEERLLIAAMVLKPKMVQTIQGAGDVFGDPVMKEAAKQLFSILADRGTIEIATIQNVLDENLLSWIREMALVEEEENVWEKAVADCLAKIQAKNLGFRLRALNQEIILAETQGNEAALLQLLNEKTKLIENPPSRQRRREGEAPPPLAEEGALPAPMIETSFKKRNGI